jgi:hypothetical protein
MLVMSNAKTAATLLVWAASLVMACGGSAENSPGGAAGGSAGSAGSGMEGGTATTNCELAPKGQFTFHIRNTSTMPMKLALGCGAKIPIELDTPDGRLGTGPGNADPCEKSCDLVYTDPIPQCPGFCTDCGNGELVTIAAGATDDIQWDRRVYVAKMAEQQCLVDPTCPAGQNCAFGIAVSPKADQTGTLTICTDPNAAGVYCPTSRTVNFTIDTSSAEGTIEAN